jgi:hypothetical protein
MNDTSQRLETPRPVTASMPSGRPLRAAYREATQKSQETIRPAKNRGFRRARKQRD